MKNKLVVFDFADTLAYLGPSKEAVLAKYILEKYSIEISEPKLSEIYHYLNNFVFYSSVSVRNSSTKKEFYQNYNKKIIELLGLSHVVDSASLFAYFRENKQHWILKQNVIDVLSNLKSRGFLICLLSNFDSSLDTLLNDLDIRKFFDSIYISQTVGFEKPDVRFFNLPLQDYGIAAKNAYFIGDNYYLDFVPATNLGMNAILLDESSRYEYLEKDKKISALEGVLKKLER